MNWAEAVNTMLAGKCVRRESEMWNRVIQHADEDLGEPLITESGQEGACLMHAWTSDDKPVQVYVGASSKCLFVPDGDHMNATDWKVVERKDA